MTARILAALLLLAGTAPLACALPDRSTRPLSTAAACERLSKMIEYCPRNGTLAWWSPEWGKGPDVGLNADYSQNLWVMGNRVYRVRDLMGRAL